MAKNTSDEIVDVPRQLLALLGTRHYCLRPKYIVQDLNILFKVLRTSEYDI